MAQQSEKEEVVPTISTHIDWKSRNRHQQFQEISVYGSWNRFLEPATLEYQGSGTFAVDLELPLGDHHYRFLVDDDWKTDDSKPKTIQHGEEFNTISVCREEEQDEEGDEDVPGSAEGGSMIYDAVNQSFRIGKGKNERRRRGRPSMEISLPSNYFTGSNQSKLDDITEENEEGAGRRKRRKKKKKKKNKGGVPSDFSSNAEVAAAFKQKEEEWARMCFVQQLKQQQQHNDEIQRVKTLWKQERQVRVEMHKKVVGAKADLEKRLQGTESENERLKSNMEVEVQTQEKKLEQITREKDKAESEKHDLREQIREHEDQLRKLRHEKAQMSTEQQKVEAGRTQELSHLRAEIAAKSATIDGLQGQLEAVNQNMAQIQDMHKRTLAIEQDRYDNIQNVLNEEKMDKLTLKESNNEIQRELMAKEREAQRLEDQLTTSENKLRQNEQDNVMLKEKLEDSKTNLREAQLAAQDTSRIHEATEKVRISLEGEKNKLQVKIDALKQSAEDQKHNYEDIIGNMRAQHEEQIATMGEQNQQVAAAAAQINEINKRLEDKDDLINSTRIQLAKAEENLSELNAEHNSVLEQLTQAQGLEGERNGTIDRLNNDINDLKQQLESAHEETSTGSHEAQQLKIDLESKISQLEGEVSNQKREAQSATDKNDRLNDENSKLEEQVEKLQKNIDTLQTDLNKMNQNSSGFEQELNKVRKALESEQKKCGDMGIRVEELETEFGEREEELLNKLREAEEDLDRLTEQANHRIHDLEKQQEELLTELSTKQQIFADVEARLQKMENEMRIAKDSWEKEKETLQSRLSVAEARDERILTSCKSMFTEFQSVRKTLDTIRSEKIEMVERMNGFFPDMQQLLTKAFGFNQKLVAEVTEKYKREMSARRKYFNKLQELRGNIRVFCRVRPLLGREIEEGYRNCISFPEEEQLIIHQADNKTNDIIEHFFEFDKVYPPSISQEMVCEDTTEYIQSVMDGYNVSIFAYGQTGSGKTYTMMGPVENPGVNRRALNELFKIVKERDGMYDYTITLSIFEIYNDKPRDLLLVKTKKTKEKTYQVRTDSDGSVYIPGLEEREVTNMDEVLAAMALADTNRTQASTKMNLHSSRSHMLLSVFVRGFNKPANIEYRGRLYLVDLAGSERVGKSGAKGQNLKEAQHINKSLAALGDVMQALQSKSKFIPFRNSILTYLMSNSLGGHAKTIMFINCCPTNEHCIETCSSLKFAKRVAKVELGKAEAATTAPGGKKKKKKKTGKRREQN